MGKQQRISNKKHSCLKGGPTVPSISDNQVPIVESKRLYQSE